MWWLRLTRHVCVYMRFRINKMLGMWREEKTESRHKNIFNERTDGKTQGQRFFSRSLNERKAFFPIRLYLHFIFFQDLSRNCPFL